MKKKQFQALAMIFVAIIVGFIDGVIYGRLAMVLMCMSFGFFGWLYLYKTLIGKYAYIWFISWVVKQNKKWFRIGTEVVFYKRLMDWWEKITLDEVEKTEKLEDLRQLIKIIPPWENAYLTAQAKIDKIKHNI